jgi:hypothetical protein
MGLAVRRYLLEHDESQAISEAFANGLGALHDFGARVAQDMGIAPSREATRCVVLQVADAIGLSSDILRRLRGRLR